MFEAHFTRFMHFNQRFISREWCATSRESQYKRTFSCWLKLVDTLNNVCSRPFTNLCCRFQWDKSHVLPLDLNL
ncbi:Uncharacterised protein [Vibrio cholerae]|nr:Uncharacterised protein [Vibrio cholerae]